MVAHGGSPVGAQDSPLVLVVEDDRDTRHLYVLTLSAHGFRTVESHNGLQALDKATATIPDLILTDIAVPGIDGIELCRRLRGDARTAAIPILAVTGYGDRHYPDRAMAAGANHVLIKPFTAETLVAEATRLLGESRDIPDRSIA
jgi:two-component system cell cycle response regulator DivK